MSLQLLQVLVVGELHLVAEVDDVCEELAIVLTVVHSILDAAVQVHREHALRTRRHTTGTKRVAETVVLNLIAQAAAARQRVGIVAHVGEERVALGIHLCCEISPLLVYAVAVMSQQSHRLNRECEHGLRALLVEPLHETLLQP